MADALVHAVVTLVRADLLVQLQWPVVAAIWWRGLRTRRFPGATAFQACIPRRRWQLVAAAGLLPVLLRCGLLIPWPAPVPYIHDEFANIVLAKTFEQGRLANPSHPLWQHFEAPHIVQQPLYYSYRPPAPGWFLAAAHAITGSWWFGVCFSAGLMCAAVCWMLLAWFPPRWAALGSFLAALQISVFSYWMNSYWGGQWAALGGALMLGSLGHARRGVRAWHGLVFAAGLAVAVHTRPFESVMFTAGLAASAIWYLAKHRRQVSVRSAVLTAAPGVAAVACLLAWSMHYNRALTGSAFRLPYAQGIEQYKSFPAFAWQAAEAPKIYNHESLRRVLWVWEGEEYARWERRSLAESFAVNLGETWTFFVRPALTLPLIVGFAGLLRGSLRVLLPPLLCVLAGMYVSVWYNPHYIAGLTPVFFAVITWGLRWLWLTGKRRGRPIATAGAFACVAVCAAFFGAEYLRVAAGVPNYAPHFRGWHGPFPQLQSREAVARRFAALPGRHLVVVRYSPAHPVHEEWVYNEADIDGAAVVWAREMDGEANTRLRRYFEDREAWLVEPDADPVRVSRW